MFILGEGIYFGRVLHNGASRPSRFSLPPSSQNLQHSMHGQVCATRTHKPNTTPSNTPPHHNKSQIGLKLRVHRGLILDGGCPGSIGFYSEPCLRPALSSGWCFSRHDGDGPPICPCQESTEKTCTSRNDHNEGSFPYLWVAGI